MSYLFPADVADAVTGFATLFAGITTVFFTLSLGRQPARWLAVYISVIITGIPTIWYHGTLDFTARVFDIGTNLLVAWLVTRAALDDGYTPGLRNGLIIFFGVVDVLVIAGLVATGTQSGFSAFAVGVGNYRLPQLALLVNSLAGVLLLFGRLRFAPKSARPLLYLTTGWFLLGAIFASQPNEKIDADFIVYHAIWHLLSAFGFLFLWAYNHARFISAAPDA